MHGVHTLLRDKIEYIMDIETWVRRVIKYVVVLFP